ncbi:uncharacterized protein BX664DRAFT_344056 [Halteromyces radiatus]|uniref:uncharacterized protein n=1 Tax=Halteromyces radiatus TaxID=101107 RepID=UPI00221FD6F4|nr:uncharacterized protein BX664DRAFT_344056 [Halteromyces radiatus]KAI8076830.1 hypothetical protein BX664DRAFT_344056 [Halteromyces radiatus]
MYRLQRALTNRHILNTSKITCGKHLSMPSTPNSTVVKPKFFSIRYASRLTVPRQQLKNTVSKVSTNALSTIRPFVTVADKTVYQSPYLNWKLFPDFEKLLTQTAPAVAIPVFQELLTDTRTRFLELEKSFEPTWEGTIGKLTELEIQVSRAFGILSHLNGVKNSPELRSTLEQIQPEFIKLSLLMNQSVPKYKALEELKNSAEWDHLDSVQQRIVENTLRDMKHAGIGFPEGSLEKKRFNEISERLSQLSLGFNNNVLDATKSFKKVITNKSDLDGCSDTFLETLKKNAVMQGLGDDVYCITLDAPIYGPLMMNCNNRSLRETIYKANVTKASEGTLNNELLINEILTLRHEMANLLGYKTYAHLSLSVKMAHDPETVEKLLDQLYASSLDHAKQELVTLAQFAVDHLQYSPDEHGQVLSPWDTAYVSEQYRKSLYKYDEETISEYFAFPNVLQGLFEVTDQVLGIQVRELTADELEQKNITRWHDDVKVFQVSEHDQVKAYFYGDFYSRPSEKRSGAWMDTVTSRYKDQNGNVTLPVAYLICNQASPQSADKPSLMKFRDVETLFHEFGHGLQHMMTRVDYAEASGINGVEWDFVEVASQFMENFCSEPKWLERMSGHYQTGEPMPKDMVDALVKNRQFLSGMAMLRQLHFAKVDLALHSSFKPPSTPDEPTVFDVDAEIAKMTTLVPRLPEDRFLCSFSHIFGGGYSAGYYSYKYSETFSADAYGAFEEAEINGESLSKVGQRYRDTVLALGGGTPPRDVWEKFRGRRDVDVNALLRHSGLQ